MKRLLCDGLMYTCTHVVTALILCSLLRNMFSRRTLFLFALGSFPPDIDHLYMHRFLFHNVFFVVAISAISRSPALTLGILLHLFEDFVASTLDTLVYPLARIELGLNWSWLYSAQANLIIAVLFLSILLFREGFILRRRGKGDLLRLFTMLLGSLSFGAGSTSTILFGYISTMLVELARFLGTALLLIGFFSDEHASRVKFKCAP